MTEHSANSTLTEKEAREICRRVEDEDGRPRLDSYANSPTQYVGAKMYLSGLAQARKEAEGLVEAGALALAVLLGRSQDKGLAIVKLNQELAAYRKAVGK